MTPRDSRSFNAPLNKEPKNNTSRKRIHTEPALEDPEEVDELAVTSPRNALFLPFRLEEVDAHKK